MPGPDKETDLTERIEAFLSDLKRGGSGTGPLRGSAETARETTALLRRFTAQARWSSAGDLLHGSFPLKCYKFCPHVTRVYFTRVERPQTST